MKKFKAILFSVLCIALATLMSVEVFSAIMITLRIKGSVQFSATDIGAEIYGIQRLNTTSANNASYTIISGSGTVADDVYYENGDEYSYSNITAEVGNMTFSAQSDTLDIYMFIKNVGSRYITPTITINSSSNNFILETKTLFFDTSAGQIDPLETKTNSASADACLSTVQSAIDANNCGVFSTNSSLDNNDVFVLVAVIKLSDTAVITGGTVISSTFNINIQFSADIIYNSDTILSVYQTMGQTDPTWTKYGYNATLNATATKVGTNSIALLENALTTKDTLGNANIASIGSGVQVGADDYALTAPVYKDIDIVNIDIATGEIIGKLSDLNYNFEWYGRAITLPAGTTLASGRTLTTEETFTVDVYTYYPTMYIRRWAIGDKQWISISDQTFRGASKIDAYYTATFEATLFNPDKTVATNDNGVIARSYNSDYINTSGLASYLISHYGYSDSTGTLNEAYNQTNTLKYCTNLTKAWQSKVTEDPTFANYTIAKTCQGDNYKVFVYNLLYLIKYANNNSQGTVGDGNTNTYGRYTDVTLTDINGTDFTANQYYESIKGSTIGLYNGANQNAAKMYYGYMSEYQNGNDKQGLYPVQFLTYNTGSNKYLRDGYVGSNGSTAVFCLGQCNPWGNAYKWVFGMAILGDGVENKYIYVQLTDYDYQTANYITTSSSGYASNVTKFTDKGYIGLSYTLPTETAWYTYCDISTTETENGLETLIGLPSSRDTANGGSTTGLCDYFYQGSMSATSSLGVLRGGATDASSYAGAFCFYTSITLGGTISPFAFRASLTA